MQLGRERIPHFSKITRGTISPFSKSFGQSQNGAQPDISNEGGTSSRTWSELQTGVETLSWIRLLPCSVRVCASLLIQHTPNCAFVSCFLLSRRRMDTRIVLRIFGCSCCHVILSPHVSRAQTVFLDLELIFLSMSVCGRGERLERVSLHRHHAS